jgi:hypothetical protein
MKVQFQIGDGFVKIALGKPKTLEFEYPRFIQIWQRDFTNWGNVIVFPISTQSKEHEQGTRKDSKLQICTPFRFLTLVVSGKTYGAA